MRNHVNICGRDGNPIPGIGGVTGCVAGSEAEANACLAAAAVDMLEALQLAESIIHAVEADHDKEESPALAKIRKAIARATASDPSRIAELNDRFRK